MSVSLSSLLSGSGTSSIDSLVAQYMALEQGPVDTLKSQKDELNVRSAMFSDLKTKIGELKTLADELAGIDPDAFTTPTTVFDGHTVSSSDSTLATATATASAANGTYLLDNIVLAKAHRVESAQLSNSWTAESDGTFVINGTQISVSAGDTLADLRSAINSATYATGRGVVATLINVDGENSRLVLDARSTGTEYAIGVSDRLGIDPLFPGARHDRQQSRGDRERLSFF